jgi:hypothetical protein
VSFQSLKKILREAFLGNRIWSMDSGECYRRIDPRIFRASANRDDGNIILE